MRKNAYCYCVDSGILLYILHAGCVDGLNEKAEVYIHDFI